VRHEVLPVGNVLLVQVIQQELTLLHFLVLKLLGLKRPTVLVAVLLPYFLFLLVLVAAYDQVEFLQDLHGLVPLPFVVQILSNLFD